MSNSNAILVKANDWFAKDLSLEQIEAELLHAGTEPRHIPELLVEIKKLRNARKTSRGLVLILIGAVFCLLSCLLTIMSLGNTTLVLYGFTSIGIIIVFTGLMFIFG